MADTPSSPREPPPHPAPAPTATAAAARAPLVDPSPSSGRDSLLIAISFLASSLSGAGVALVLGFAASGRVTTDAVLAAYSIYTIVVLLAPAARTALVPVFGPTADEAAFRLTARREGSRASALGLAAALGVVLVAPVLAPLLTAHLHGPHVTVTAIATLVMLAPAIALQFHAAACSAALSAVRRFAFSAWAYTAGALVTFAAAVPLILAFGPLGAPGAILIGAVVIAFAHDHRLRTLDLRLRPDLRGLTDRGQWRLAGTLISVSAIGVAINAELAIGVANVSGDTGDVTRYTYAFFAMMTVVSMTSGAASLVGLPALIERLHRGEPGALREYFAAALPAIFAIVVPLLVLVAAVGRPALGVIFGSTFSDGQIDQLHTLLLLMMPLALAYSVLLMVQTAGVALGRERVFLPLAGGVVALHLVLALLVRDDTEAVAAVHGAMAVVMTVTAVRLVLGPGGWRLIGGALFGRNPA